MNIKRYTASILAALAATTLITPSAHAGIREEVQKATSIVTGSINDAVGSVEASTVGFDQAAPYVDQLKGIAADSINAINTHAENGIMQAEHEARNAATQVPDEIAVTIAPGHQRVLDRSLPEGTETTTHGTNGVMITAGGQNIVVVEPTDTITRYNPARPKPVAAPAASGVWAALAQCESGGNPSINTGNGYYGMYQFSQPTWLSIGGGQYAPRADLATPEQQTEMAMKLQARSGWGQWPACSAKLGLR